MAARELGWVSLGDALSLVTLYAETDDRKFERAAVRWSTGSLKNAWPRCRRRGGPASGSNSSPGRTPTSRAAHSTAWYTGREEAYPRLLDDVHESEPVRCAECGRQVSEAEAEREGWGFWSGGLARR